MKPQDSSPDLDMPDLDLPFLPPQQGLARLRLLPGTLARLGPRALALYARHRLSGGHTLPPDAALPAPPFLWPEAAAAPVIDWCPGVPDGVPALRALAVPTAGQFDIRLVWETGRLVDLPALAPPAAEAMVRDFLAANPPFRGPHWACGQEASIRLAHLLAAQAAIGGAMLPGFLALVRLHRDRIAATLSYAMAQDNNHAVSEAAGLWASSLVLGDASGAARGRGLLERAVLRLFAPSGAFSQQSMRYHVVALEMAAFGQRIARGFGAAGLGQAALARLAAGAAWLARIADPASGRAWRVGNDDSSRFFGGSLEDVRPTLERVDAELPPCLRARESGTLWLDRQGGFASLSLGPLRAYLRLPVHRFRPAQADALHLDLWLGGDTLLGDPGTCLYNANADLALPDLARTAAHNTIAFDDDDQMPRLSRFLYGAWLRPAAIEAEPGRIGASYRDWKGRLHTRALRIGPGEVAVADAVAGNFREARLRWRLPEAPWQLDGIRLSGGPFMLSLVGAQRLRLVRLPFAPRYGQRATQPALEATLAPGSATTTLIRVAESPAMA